MRPEAELKRRLQSLAELEGAVAAMRSLSAHHFRKTREAVASMRTYREGVERIASWTRATMPAGTGAAGLVVVGGELGLCGSYNVRVVEAAVRARAELGPGPTFCVGHRAGLLLARKFRTCAERMLRPRASGGSRSFC